MDRDGPGEGRDREHTRGKGHEQGDRGRPPVGPPGRQQVHGAEGEDGHVGHRAEQVEEPEEGLVPPAGRARGQGRGGQREQDEGDAPRQLVGATARQPALERRHRERQGYEGGAHGQRSLGHRLHRRAARSE